ncbi:MAG: hypothetical protein H7Y20_09510 [Bryobacteraceae bacterium]|nr:hypothetical protein [Bryobacteraceae bacterium]
MLILALLLSVPPVLWTDPGPIDRIDFELPARGVALPTPPFQFVREDLSGNSPKVLVKDADGIVWQVKGGPEGRAEAFASRMAAALGYYTDSIAFFHKGRIEGVNVALKRASGFLSSDGAFTYAGFERREPQSRFLTDEDWTWIDNPFTGTKELKGLKIFLMLISNWDNKDKRDARQGSNTGILEVSSAGEIKRYFYVTDWGQSLGAWGLYTGRSGWNCADYSRQTPEFVTGSDGPRLTFGFGGQRTSDFSHDIARADVEWLMQRLGVITDRQIRTALRVSGASAEEEDCFSRALRQRIEALRNVSKPAP